MSEDSSTVLPHGWSSVRLGDLIFGIEAGKSFRCEPRVAGDDEWGVVKVSAMTWGVFDESENKVVPPERVDPSKEIRPGDILLSRSNTAELVGASVLVGSCRRRLLLSDKSLRLVYSGALSSRWLQGALSSPSARDQMSRLATGTSDSMRNLSQDKLYGVQLLLPPANEQQRIVESADELLSDLDAGVAALERVRERLSDFRASVLKAAVEGALTAEWRRQHPATEGAEALLTRILVERRRRWEAAQLAKFEAAGKTPPKDWKQKYVEPTPPDTAGLPALGEEGRWVSLDQIAEIAGGITKGQRVAESIATRDVPYLRVANVQRGFLDLTEVKEIRASESDVEALRLLPGDVLFNEGGDRDKLGRGWIWEGQIEECIHQNHVFRARPLLKDIRSRIVSWSGNSYGQKWFMRTGKQSVNLASINLTVLRSFPVPLFPTAEQDAIVEAVEEQLSLIDQLERDLEIRLRSAQALRQSILRHAFTGRLVPQDANDEPAGELLKRIQAEKEERARVARAAKQVKLKTNARHSCTAPE